MLVKFILFPRITRAPVFQSTLGSHYRVVLVIGLYSLSGQTKSFYLGKKWPDNELYTKQKFGPIMSTARRTRYWANASAR